MDDPIHKERHQTAETGVVLALIVGEVTATRLTFGDSQKARLGLTVSTPIPSSFVGNNQCAFLTNRIVFWGKIAEELGRKVKPRNFETKEAGTKIVIFSSRYGQRKVKDNEYTHEFTGSGYRIIEEFGDVIEILSEGQEQGIIPVTKVLIGE